MEDISRELEREIARAKPTPYRTNRKKNILVVNDFGEMKSGRYLWVLVRLLALTSLVFGLATAGLYYLYDHQADKAEAMEKRLVILEKKKNQLTNEKEILMAQLVMAGDKPLLGEVEAPEAVVKTAKADTKKSEGKMAGQAAGDQKPSHPVDEKAPESASSPNPPVDTGLHSVDMKAAEETGANVAAKPTQSSDVGAGADTETPKSQVIAVEKFSVSQSSDHDELRVRFNIRNIKEGPGEISGRIFLVLKPEGGEKTDWIVAPKAPMAENGVPSDYKRGQYFSISRFKPVKFTIPSRIPPQRLKMTGVFIFDDEGQLIFNEMVETSQKEAG